MPDEKVKVTPEQMGHILFYLALLPVNKLEEKDTIKILGLEKSDKFDVYREMLTIDMFVIIEAIDGFIKDKNLGNQVLDEMHKVYFDTLKEQGDYPKIEIATEREFIIARYEEYAKATEEKRGPNWLWPLANHMLNNLRKEDVKDPSAMMTLTSLFAPLMNGLPDLVSKYEVVVN